MNIGSQYPTDRKRKPKGNVNNFKLYIVQAFESGQWATRSYPVGQKVAVSLCLRLEALGYKTDFILADTKDAK